MPKELKMNINVTCNTALFERFKKRMDEEIFKACALPYNLLGNISTYSSNAVSYNEIIEDMRKAKLLTPIYVSRNYYNALIKYCNKECSLAYFMHNIIGD